MYLRLALVSLLSLALVPSDVDAKPKRSAKTKKKPKATPVETAPPPVEPPPPPPVAPSAPAPTAAELLSKVDAIVWPPRFEAQLTFVTHKPKGDSTFTMRIAKKGNRFRTWFLSPADDAGAEILRIEDDFWNYLPNLKRTLKIAGKHEFHGGDFANSDVLSLDLTRDYTPSLASSAPDKTWVLDLAAKSPSVTYARIRITVRKEDGQPTSLEYFATSGKLVRTMELSELKRYGALVRPSHFVMRNMLEPKRFTDLVYDKFAIKPDLEDAVFDRQAMGR